MKHRSTNINMTEGRPIMLLLAFSLPLFIGNLFQQAYNMADSVIVGRLLGAGSFAAVGATTSVSFLFFSVCNGIGSGGGIITSQFFGGGDIDKVKKAITNSAYLMIGVSAVMGAVAFVASPFVLAMIGTPEDIMEEAVIYMRVSCVGVPMIALYNYASSMLRALGDSKVPLYFLIFACILNVILDLLFVGSFGMGVFGAALATALSQLTSGLGCLIFAFMTNPCFKLKRSHFVFDKKIFFGAARLGVPLAMQWGLIAVSTTALQLVVNSFGTAAVAAFTATSRIEMLAHQPFGSLGTALSTYAGQNFGAGRIDRVKNGLNESGVLMMAFTLLIWGLMQLFGEQMIGIFVTDAEVIAMGGTALRLTSWFYIFLGVIYIIRGTLNGVGDALFSLINGIIEVICRIGLPYILLLIPMMGVWGIWWTAALTWLISAVFCALRYLAWRKKTVKSGI